MKKLIMLVVAIFAMSFASNNLFAQNDETSQAGDRLISSVVSEEADDAGSYDATVSTETEGKAGGEITTAPTDSPAQNISVEDIQALAAFLNDATKGKKQNILNADGKVFVPLSKHGKIGGHHICQRLELSILTGQDKSATEIALSELGLDRQPNVSSSDVSKADNFLDDITGKGNGFNFGANFGYSLVFVPGYKEGDNLLLNRFGFGYSVGAIFQFDREKEDGVTCDLLGKVGVETGFNKAIGVGVDFLAGGGKTSQAVMDFTYVEEKDPKPEDVEISTESLWCGKIGMQLWLRLNFLTKSIKNFDTALFTRYVYSFRPYSQNEFSDRVRMYNEVTEWKDESWQFGFTMTYFF